MGPNPATVTEKVAVWPTTTVWFAGWVTILRGVAPHPAQHTRITITATTHDIFVNSRLIVSSCRLIHDFPFGLADLKDSTLVSPPVLLEPTSTLVTPKVSQPGTKQYGADFQPTFATTSASPALRWTDCALSSYPLSIPPMQVASRSGPTSP